MNLQWGGYMCDQSHTDIQERIWQARNPVKNYPQTLDFIDADRCICLQEGGGFLYTLPAQYIGDPPQKIFLAFCICFFIILTPWIPKIYYLLTI